MGTWEIAALEAAHDGYSRALEYDENWQNPDVLLELSKVYMGYGAFDGALKIFAHFMNVFPTCPGMLDTVFQPAVIARHCGQHKSAIKMFRWFMQNSLGMKPPITKIQELGIMFQLVVLYGLEADVIKPMKKELKAMEKKVKDAVVYAEEETISKIGEMQFYIDSQLRGRFNRRARASVRGKMVRLLDGEGSIARQIWKNVNKLDRQWEKLKKKVDKARGKDPKALLAGSLGELYGTVPPTMRNGHLNMYEWFNDPKTWIGMSELYASLDTPATHLLAADCLHEAKTLASSQRTAEQEGSAQATITMHIHVPLDDMDEEVERALLCKDIAVAVGIKPKRVEVLSVMPAQPDIAHEIKNGTSCSIDPDAMVPFTGNRDSLGKFVEPENHLGVEVKILIRAAVECATIADDLDRLMHTIDVVRSIEKQAKDFDSDLYLGVMGRRINFSRGIQANFLPYFKAGMRPSTPPKPTTDTSRWISDTNKAKRPLSPTPTQLPPAEAFLGAKNVLRSCILVHAFTSRLRPSLELYKKRVAREKRLGGAVLLQVICAHTLTVAWGNDWERIKDRIIAQKAAR